MAAWQIEQLAAVHLRQPFCSGQSLLDDFIQKRAMQYVRRDIAHTYVAVLPPDMTVLGYYTIAAGSVEFKNLPIQISRKLPRHPIPIAHLGRLAVDQSARGQRLGETLLLDVFARCYRLSREIGMFAVEVYALDDTAKQFYLKYGFTECVDDQLHLYLPIRKIKDVVES